MMASVGGRFRELLKKYGKVAVGVHFSVSAASISGLYIAIKSNVDVESMLEKVGFRAAKQEEEEEEKTKLPQSNPDGFIFEEMESTVTMMEMKKTKNRNRTAELATSSGGALALAVLCNKALFPIRVPITIALTPPVARFLARRQSIKNSV
ncbi:hypothetical protein LOK49_LG02G03929 [Camellia lanceoleosa]|uniref:Uncharacterized protein n=1 Tax=Camellia lanceoleosa TaxID=1840588 RepID=A0ACC0IPX1_9ERIC|nr:hypothetical protein LOK49_LG02G03929 [Camellia lanceoleosa]